MCGLIFEKEMIGWILKDGKGQLWRYNNKILLDWKYTSCEQISVERWDKVFILTDGRHFILHCSQTQIMGLKRMNEQNGNLFNKREEIISDLDTISFFTQTFLTVSSVC